MAYKVGANNALIADEKGVYLPKFTTSTRPSSPVQGQVIYNTDTGFLEMWDNSLAGWTVVSTTSALLVPFLYRTIITTGYVMAGYQSTSPWKNVNKMAHATDVCSNLGDLLPLAGAYCGGGASLTKGFIWGADNAWPGTTTNIVSFNMASDSSVATIWTMRNSRNDCESVFKETLYSYIFGGGPTDVDVFNMTTETVLGAQGLTSMGGQPSYQYGVSAISDETKGFVWGDANQKLTFGTGAAATISTGAISASNSQQKGINSKLGKGYCGNEGDYNGGYNLRRWQFSTETSLGTVAKPVGNSGEENFDMGQAHQYMYGMYDGAQNNRGWRFSYTTETGTELGSGSIRTGVPGGSSGACAWKG
jgi:hypothetical protein